ncbi:MAG: GYF domain-containing protein, partial [Polyangiaceae bacterium]
MKFLCPSCKAKYQIGDEKVAGRSVRMKCRKCGYVIQVSSVAGMGDALPGSEPPPAGIDALSDASAAPPPAEALMDFEHSEPPPPVAPVPAKAAPPPPAKSAPLASAPKATVPGASGPQRPEVKKPATAPVARPSVPKPAAAPLAKAPLPAAKSPAAPLAKPAAQKPATVPTRPSAPGGAPAVALKSEKLTMQGGVGASLTTEAVKSAIAAANKPAARISALPEFEEEESTRIADAGALAGAFSLAVGGGVDAPSPDSQSMPADEWFVGINGVPVGPIRLSELRSKAASGSVNRESLVWRDGFEDWRPLKTFPELTAIVDESVSSARASLTPFTPAVGTAFGPAPSGDPIVLPGVAAATAAAAATTGEAFAGSGVTGTAVVTDDLEAAGVPKRTGTSPAAWIAVAIALLFGLTIGFVIFNKAGASKTIEVVKYVDRPVPGASSAAAAAPDAPAAADDTTATGDAKNAVKHATGVAKPTGSAAPATTAEPISGLKGLQGLSSLGPSRGPDGTSGPSGTVSGTGQLDGAQIQSTVARYTGSVKRACWQPALDTRDKDAPTTARVNVAITVLPSGSVSNAAVGGDPKGY